MSVYNTVDIVAPCRKRFFCGFLVALGKIISDPFACDLYIIAVLFPQIKSLCLILIQQSFELIVILRFGNDAELAVRVKCLFFLVKSVLQRF